MGKIELTKPEMRILTAIKGDYGLQVARDWDFAHKGEFLAVSRRLLKLSIAARKSYGSAAFDEENQTLNEKIITELQNWIQTVESE